MENGCQDEKQYWENWLESGDGKYRNKIIRAVSTMYREEDGLQPPLPFFTPHGIEHLQNVENRIHELIPKKTFESLNPRERFYLLASAWLHDLGMLRSVANLYFRTHFDRDARVEEIRKLHHVIGRWFIINYPSKCGIRDGDQFILADLAFYHRKQEDLNRCESTQTVGGYSYRTRLLAGYLRLADALDVSLSRTPMSAYLLCLAYGIPAESKIHWIKSRLVSGIQICHADHRIRVQFQRPTPEDLARKHASMSWVEEKIRHIIDIVMDDLRDELASVMYTLTQAGFAFYIDLEKSENQGVDEQTLDDLLGLVMNYDILIAPSASKLLEMILHTIANIAGYNLRPGAEEADRFRQVSDPKKTAGEIRSFLAMIRSDILSQRRCHYGIRSLVESCEQSKALKAAKLAELVAEVNSQFQLQHDHRNWIRANAAKLVKKHLGPAVKDESVVVNILLFGYSELVIKAICGFRDGLMKARGYTADRIKRVYGSDDEKEFSRRFRIFVCDGQSKTQTAPRDRLIYHDGLSYAKALKKRNFTNLILMPDIVAGNVIENQDIDFVLVGANGFDESCFKHSAGHGSIIKLAREHRQSHHQDQQDQPGKPQVVLVVSSDKWGPASTTGAERPTRDEAADESTVEGFPFWKGATGTKTRDQIWFTRDERVFGELKRQGEIGSAEHQPARTAEVDIHLFNPREDVMPIREVDWIISDAGCHRIAGPKKATTRRRISTFLEKIRSSRPFLPDHGGRAGR